MLPFPSLSNIPYFLYRVRMGKPEAANDIAAPGGMIGAQFPSNCLWSSNIVIGLTSSVALATIVGVLVEVPDMLTLVGMLTDRHWFRPSQRKRL